jgi:hypothetical protein
LYKVYKDKKPLAEEIGNISTTVIGAMKNVVEKTVEIANSINPENGQENKDNNAAPTNTNTNVEPATNIEVFNVDNNNFNNSVGIKDNSDNNNILKQNNNNETNNSMNFNTNLETNNNGINDQNNFENNINDNENKDIPNV